MPDGRRGTVKPNIHNDETILGGGSRIEQISPKEKIGIVDSRRGREGRGATEVAEHEGNWR